MISKEVKYCACGCGQIVSSIDARKPKNDGKYYICNHQRYFTKERKKEISEWSKKLWSDIEHQEKMKNVWTGRKHTEETKQKMREVSDKRLTKEVRSRISKTLTGRVQPEEVNEKRRQTMKEHWADPVKRQKHLETMHNGFELPTKPEKKVRKWLNKLFPEEYKYVGDGDVWIGGKNPDFINVNGQKKIIEVFGEYWHGPDRTGVTKKEHRKERQKHFSKYGYDTLVIWENQLQNSKKVKERLKEFHVL